MEFVRVAQWNGRPHYIVTVRLKATCDDNDGEVVDTTMTIMVTERGNF